MSRGAGFDPEAPLVVREERDVAASPAIVWARLSNPARWATWFRRVRFASLRGPLTPGSALIWQVDGLRVSSVILEVEEERTLGWTLRMMGGSGGMQWTLDPLPSGGTRIRVEESWGGAMVWLLRGTLRHTLESSRHEWLVALEKAAEEGVANSGTHP